MEIINLDNAQYDFYYYCLMLYIIFNFTMLCGFKLWKLLITTFMAKSLGVPKSAVELLHGDTGRIKLIQVPDDADLSAL